LGRAMVTPLTTSALGEDSVSKPFAGENPAEAGEASAAPSPDASTELGAEPTAIDAETEESAAAARSGIMREFAGAIEAAHKHLPRLAVRGAVAALKQMRKAALALVKRRTAERRAGKQMARPRRANRNSKGGGKPTNNAPRLH
jgi:hypothetical protein